MCSQNDHRFVESVAAEFAAQVIPSAVREPEVGNDEIGGVGERGAESGGVGVRFQYSRAPFAAEVAERLSIDGIILHEEEPKVLQGAGGCGRSGGVGLRGGWAATGNGIVGSHGANRWTDPNRRHGGGRMGGRRA